MTENDDINAAGSNPFAGKSERLRVLMLTWEYPPRIVGGISRVVEGLSKGLTRLGVEVHVITNEMPGSPAEQDDEGVHVHRVRIESPAPNFHSWVLLMNHYFAKRAGRLAQEAGCFDIVHVHDWLTLPSGAETKSYLGAAMVSTLHSLEFKRSVGIITPESKMVDSFEWWITFESGVVIVCSNSMKQDSIRQFKVPEEKIWVIPIGIDPTKLERVHPDRNTIRARYGISQDEKIILFIGRLTSQKGCEYLIRAIPFVSRYHNVRLLIAGDGYMRGDLEKIASSSEAQWRVKFLGFVPDRELTELLLSSDVMVIPSIYEPFGVVALEAMAAGVPVVASKVDGLAEIVNHEQNGILVFPKDSSSIAWGISRVLSDAANSRRLVENAKNEISTKYTWDAVSRLTLRAYLTCLGSHR